MNEPHPKDHVSHRPADQELAEDEVRRAVRELGAYFRGKRSHREALTAIKAIKRYVRQQQKHAEGTTSLRLVGPPKKPRKGA